jgi:hypothetical protein
MKPAERIPLLKKLAAALASEDMPWDDMTLDLRQFGFTSDDVWGKDGFGNYLGPDRYGFALHHLENSGDDEKLLELERFLDPSAGEGATPPTLPPGPWKRTDTFRLFISHTHENAPFASGMKRYLAKYRFECFVAHSDITPSEKWMEVIQSALLSSHALAALVTPDFRESQWCDQEIGFALARSMLVVPLMRDAPPHGFLSEFQAIKLKEHTPSQSAALSVFEILAKHKETRDRMAGPVVRRYTTSDSFEKTREAFALLKRIPKDAWTPELVYECNRAPYENTQVKNAKTSAKDGTPIPEAAKKLLLPIERALDIEGDIPF